MLSIVTMFNPRASGRYQPDRGTYPPMIHLNRGSRPRPDPVGSHRRIASEPTVNSRAGIDLSNYDGNSKRAISLPTLLSEACFKPNSRASPAQSFEMKELTVETREHERGDGGGSGSPVSPVSSHLSGPPHIPNVDSPQCPDRSKPGNVPLKTDVPQVQHNSSRVDVCRMSDTSFGAASPQENIPQPEPYRPLKHLVLEFNPKVQREPPNARRHEPTSFEKGWERIKRLRNEIWGLRSRIHEMRKDLKEKQLAKSAADDRYFQFVRIHGTLSNVPQNTTTVPGSIMAQLFHECEVARDIYGPLEDDCTLLENYLGSQELELQRLEDIFYSREFEPSKPYLPLAETIDSSRHSSVSSITPEFALDRHPLLSEYFSKLGAVEIMRERLDDLVEHRYILEEEQETRAKVGKELADSDQRWLRDYSSTEDTMIKEFETAEEQAANLRRRCFNLGLLDEEGAPTDFETQEQYTFANDDVDPGSETSEYVKFPLLIPPPGNEKVEVQESAREYDEGSEISNDRISYWLLNRLRTSALEVKLLSNIFEAAVGKIEHGEKWQVDVLAFWFDDVVESELKPRNTSTGSSTRAPQDIPLPSSLGSESASARSWGIIIKSSSLRPSHSGSKSDETQKRYSVLLPIVPPKHQFLSKSA